MLFPGSLSTESGTWWVLNSSVWEGQGCAQGPFLCEWPEGHRGPSPGALPSVEQAQKEASLRPEAIGQQSLRASLTFDLFSI